MIRAFEGSILINDSEFMFVSDLSFSNKIKGFYKTQSWQNNHNIEKCSSTASFDMSQCDMYCLPSLNGANKNKLTSNIA